MHAMHCIKDDEPHIPVLHVIIYTPAVSTKHDYIFQSI